MSGDTIRDMKLIDFEFASNNERAYEIGAFLGETFTDEATTVEMIERYYGEVRQELVSRVWVARAVSDMKWGSWAVQQRKLSSWDFDYQKYGIWKYARAKTLFNDPRWNDWLRQI
jgi:thiamine kinase-like enzyme